MQQSIDDQIKALQDANDQMLNDLNMDDIAFDADDDSFGGKTTSVIDDGDIQMHSSASFSNPVNNIKTISAEVTPTGEVQVKHNNPIQQNNTPQSVDDIIAGFDPMANIDMECDVDEDDTFGQPVKKQNTNNQTLNFDDDDEEIQKTIITPSTNKIIFDDDWDDIVIVNGDVQVKNSPTQTSTLNVNDTDVDSELVSEQILNERKRPGRSISQGDVEKDYLKKLQKKHAATNKKGAMGHFFFCGNPPREAELFNQSFSTNGIPSPAKSDSAATSSGNITGTGEASGEGSSATGMGESYNPKYKKLYEDLLVLTGFKVNKNKDGKLELTDICDMIPNTICDNHHDVVNHIKPYINDLFIYPLQHATGETFTDPEEWCNWYTKENQQKYPKCSSDINFCDLLANHLDEIGD